MMKASKLLKRASTCLAVFLFVIGTSIAQADNSILKWKRIEGVVVPGTALGTVNVVAGVPSVGFSWSTTWGRARVNLENGHVHFIVRGLVLSAQNTTGLVIGVPSPAVTMVKGTLVCNATDPPPFNNVILTDTDAVPLSAQGNAHFSGQVELPILCDDAVFLIRVAPPSGIQDLWIAHGAVRSP